MTYMPDAAPDVDAALFSPGYLANPYPLLHRIRASDPVYWSRRWRCWLVLRYTDVVAALRDPRLSSSKMSRFNADLPPNVRQEVAPLVRYLSSFMGLSDPPDHVRLRALVSKAFTPRVVE